MIARLILLNVNEGIMALELVDKKYFDEQMKEQRAHINRLFDVWMREIAKKFASVEERLDHIEQRLTILEQRLTAVEQRLDSVEQRLDAVEARLETMEQDIRELKLDLKDVRVRVFDTAQRQEWLSLVRRVEALEKARDK